jgi:tRNA wybutosine-synthesizing protein 1
VDRPLFEDYWERLLASLDALRCKAVRTVYRLTLVKERNVAEIHQYAQLVARGEPHFIEVKGVTFCGDSKGMCSGSVLRLWFKALVRRW